MNDAFNTVMTAMVPMFLYLDVELSDAQAQELTHGTSFTVKGAEGSCEFVLEPGSTSLSGYYSPQTKKLSGYWEVRSVEGPYQGVMAVAMRPFTPTLKKCVRDTSGSHALP